MSDKPDALPDNCGQCGFHIATTLECRRHAPQPGQESEYLRAVWNLTRETDKCGAGSATKTWVQCGDCSYWNQPNDRPLTPKFQQGLGHDWWTESGLCSKSPPSATTNKGRFTFWKVTHGTTGGCGDGASVSAAREAAERKAAEPG